MRFDQPDPYEGSYDLTDPQSFNRYAYVNDDPANFTDPSGLQKQDCWRDDRGELICSEIISIYTWAEAVRAEQDRMFYFDFARNSRFTGLIEDGRQRAGGPVRQYDWSLTPEQSQQQEGFDNCAKRALSTWRKAYLRAGAKGAAGGTLIGIGIRVLRGGIPGMGLGAVGVAHTMKDAALNGLGKTMTTMIEAKDTMMAAGFPIVPGAILAEQAVAEQRVSDARFNEAIADCKRQFPSAPYAFVNTRVVLSL